MTYNFFCIGLGEGGGRVAAAFQEFNYQVAAINTSRGDLAGLAIPEDKKLLLEISQGGTGRDPLVAKTALADPVRLENIRAFIGKLIDSVHDKSKLYFLLCVGGGGGSGSGLAYILSDLFLQTGFPVGMIYTLPANNEDVVVKKNAIETFQELHNKLAVSGSISPLIIVDNALMNQQGIPITDHYALINKKVSETINTFNSFSERPSKHMSAMDTLDFGRVLSAGGVCSLGKFDIKNAVDLPLLEEQMKQSLFADGMNITSAKSAAIIVNSHPQYFKNQNISNAINFLMDAVSRNIGGGLVFRGIYEDDTIDRIDVYLVFNGMTYPQDRFARMFQDVKSGISSIKRKENRISEMSFDMDTEDALATQSFQKIKSLPQYRRTVIQCDNCRINQFTKVSQNIYLDGGPIPFTSGRCPKCKGSGIVEVSNES